jgi:purine catabolism regulator
MPTLVTDFLSLPLLKDARVVAGQKGLGHRTISWISVIEWPVEGFVRPGEMVLTCGTGCTPKMFRQLVRQVMDSGAAGLGVGTGKNRDVEAVPKTIRDMANARQFPVVEIPWEIRFADITKAAVNLIIAARYARLDDDHVARRIFTDIVLHGLGLDAIATALEPMVCRPIVILSPDFRLQAAGTEARKSLGQTRLTQCQQAHRHLSSEDTESLVRLLSSRTPRPCPGIPQLNLGAGLSAAVIVGRSVLGYLYALENGDSEVSRVLSVEANALEQAAMAVTVEALRQRAVAETEARLHGDFLWELATAEIRSLPEIETKASLLGYDPRTSYYPMLWQWERNPSPVGKGQPAGALRTQEEVERAVSENVRRLGVKTLAARRENRLLLLVEATSSVRPLIRKLADDVQKQLGRANLTPVACAIASGPHPLAELARGYAELVRTSEVGRAMVGANCVADAAELGPALMLSRLGEDPQACETAVRVLQPLIKYREKSGRDLLRTLEAYLEESGNASATARKLSLNRHSLLYRLSKIELLTGYSLHRYQDLFVLNLSLKLWRIGVLHRPDSSQQNSLAGPGRVAAR